MVDADERALKILDAIAREPREVGAGDALTGIP